MPRRKGKDIAYPATRRRSGGIVVPNTLAADYIVDPIGLTDLSLLAPFFANPEQQKVFHAAEYDLICLRRDYRFEFVNIFDTMSAARTLGWPATSSGGLTACVSRTDHWCR